MQELPCGSYGDGEPLVNYENVVRFVRIISDNATYKSKYYNIYMRDSTRYNKVIRRKAKGDFSTLVTCPE